MKIDDIFAEWEKDSEIDRNDLSEESLKIPKLHGKYYKFYVEAKMKLIQLKEDKKQLILDKHDYYRGIMPTEELVKRGWEPWRLSILKAELPMYLDADQDIIDLNLKIAVNQEKVDLIESLIKNLSMRGFQIKSAIDFMKFREGGF
jgi:folate-dependent tRNA-U54 methylase TrmFO/GidA